MRRKSWDIFYNKNFISVLITISPKSDSVFSLPYHHLNKSNFSNVANIYQSDSGKGSSKENCVIV